MLFDPFKKQFHLPPRLVDLGDGNCRKREVVGEKLEPFSAFDVEITHAAELLRVRFGRVDGGQDDSVIGPNSGALVYWMRVTTLEQDVGFGAHDEEGRAEREDVEALEIHVAAIHDIEGAGLRQKLVEDIDIVHFAAGNADERGDVAVQIQQCVHLDGGFVLSEFGPGKQRKTQVYGGGVQRVQTLFQIYADRIRCIERSCEVDQNLCEVGVDAPVMRIVGVSQSGASHPAVKPHMIEFAAERSQACFYIT